MLKKLILSFCSFYFLFFISAYSQGSDSSKAPIILKGDTLFYIFNGFEGVSTSERARIINDRINNLNSSADFRADSIQLDEKNSISRITYKNQLLLMVSDADAQKAGSKRLELATQYYETLKSAFKDADSKGSLSSLTVQVLEVLGVIVILGLLIYFTNKSFRSARLRVLSLIEKKLETIRIRKGISVSYTKRILPLIAGLLNALRLLLIIVLIYIALPILFSIFPWTEPIADRLIGYVLTPLRNVLASIIQYIPNLLTIVVIYLITRYVIKVIKFFAEEIASGALKVSQFYPDWAMPTFNIIRFLMYAFMFVVIFPYLPGSDSKVFQGVTVFLGVLFSLGSSSAIANMVSGVVLTYMRPYKLGDRVKIGDVVGDVIEKNLLVTRVRTTKNEDITVPNSTILSNYSINYSTTSKDIGLILHTTITLTYDTPWMQINELMVKAALKTDNILQSPQPFVLQTALNDFYVSYEINVYTDVPQQMAATYSELHKNLQDVFNEAGLEIMSPHVFAVRDGNSIQIPDTYKPEGYKKPGFTIEGKTNHE